MKTRLSISNMGRHAIQATRMHFSVLSFLVAFMLQFNTAHAQVPSDLMRNCNGWKITYPDGAEDKTLCGEANNEYFYAEDGAIVFFAPIRSSNGTTPNSSYIRSELREREEDGSADIYWTTTGTHMLYVKQAITHLPLVKPHLVATQIHGNKAEGIDDAMVMRLENSHLFLSFNGEKLRSDLTIKTNYTLGTVHEVIFLVKDDKHYCYYSEDGGLLDAYNNGTASSYLVTDGGDPVLMDLSYGESYFKVGNYTQSNPDREGDATNDPDNYGEVKVYDFTVNHGEGPIDGGGDNGGGDNGVTGTNVALNKSVSGTGTVDGANTPDNLVDGDADGTTSRWSVNGFPQSATIDLGTVHTLDNATISCYNDRAYQYTIEVSTDGSNYTQVVDRSNNSTAGTAASPIVDAMGGVSGRYVRVTVTGANSYTGTWVSLTEVGLYGTDTGDNGTTGTNIALNKSATSTGTIDGTNVANNVLDGNADGASRWSVNGFPQSITIDLGSVSTLESAAISCYNDRAYQYTIEVSSNGSSYAQVVDRTNNSTAGTAASPIVDDLGAVSGRYVRITISGANSYTGTWVSLTEVSIYGTEGGNGGTTTESGTVANTATVDTYLRGGTYANTSYSSETELWLKETSNDEYKRRNAFKFALNNIPANATITSAKLVLTPVALGSTAGSLVSEVYSTNNFSSLTWSDNPSYSNLLATHSSGYAVGVGTEYDVTDYLASHFSSNNSEVSFLVKSQGIDASATYLRWASAENADSNARPQLVIEYTTVTNARMADDNVASFSDVAESLNVYPIPANAFINVETAVSEISTLQVLNISGQAVISVDQVQSNKIKLDIQGLEKGIYFIRIQTNAGAVMNKRIVNY